MADEVTGSNVVATAIVAISADLSAFESQVKALPASAKKAIADAMKALDAAIGRTKTQLAIAVSLDTSKIDSQIQALQAKLAKLGQVKVNLQGAGFGAVDSAGTGTTSTGTPSGGQSAIPGGLSVGTPGRSALIIPPNSKAAAAIAKQDAADAKAVANAFAKDEAAQLKQAAADKASIEREFAAQAKAQAKQAAADAKAIEKAALDTDKAERAAAAADIAAIEKQFADQEKAARQKEAADAKALNDLIGSTDKAAAANKTSDRKTAAAAQIADAKSVNDLLASVAASEVADEVAAAKAKAEVVAEIERKYQADLAAIDKQWAAQQKAADKQKIQDAKQAAKDRVSAEREAQANAARVANTYGNQFRSSTSLVQPGANAARNRAGGDDKQKGGGAGYGLMLVGQTIDDAQYGIKYIGNNLPGLITAFGGGAGLAGAVQLSFTALATLGKYMTPLAAQLNLIRNPLTDAKAGLEGIKEQIEFINSKPLKIAGDFEAIERLTKAARELERAMAEFESMKNTDTSRQGVIKSLVQEGVKEAGGADNLADFIAEAKKKDGSYGAGSTVHGKIANENAQYNRLVGLQGQQVMDTTGQTALHNSWIAQFKDEIDKEEKEKIAQLIGGASRDEGKRKALEDYVTSPKTTDLRKKYGINEKATAPIVMAGPDNIAAAEANKRQEQVDKVDAEMRRKNEDRIRQDLGPVIAGGHDRLLKEEYDRLGQSQTAKPGENRALTGDIRKLLSGKASAEDVDVAAKLFEPELTKEAQRNAGAESVKKEGVSVAEAAQKLADAIGQNMIQRDITEGRDRLDRRGNPAQRELANIQGRVRAEADAASGGPLRNQPVKKLSAAKQRQADLDARARNRKARTSLPSKRKQDRDKANDDRRKARIKAGTPLEIQRRRGLLKDQAIEEAENGQPENVPPESGFGDQILKVSDAIKAGIEKALSGGGSELAKIITSPTLKVPEGLGGSGGAANKDSELLSKLVASNEATKDFTGRSVDLLGRIAQGVPARFGGRA